MNVESWCELGPVAPEQPESPTIQRSYLVTVTVYETADPFTVRDHLYDALIGSGVAASIVFPELDA